MQQVFTKSILRERWQGQEGSSIKFFLYHRYTQPTMTRSPCLRRMQKSYPKKAQDDSLSLPKVHWSPQSQEQKSTRDRKCEGHFSFFHFFIPFFHSFVFSHYLTTACLLPQQISKVYQSTKIFTICEETQQHFI